MTTKRTVNQLNKILATSIILILICTACKEQTKSKYEVSVNSVNHSTKHQILRHLVIFKFKDEASENDIKRINQSFNDLPKYIPVIKDFEWGLNDSPEDFDQDFTHCYLLSFESEKDRDSIYTPHPKHQAFVSQLQPHLEKVFVVDYWTKP